MLLSIVIIQILLSGVAGQGAFDWFGLGGNAAADPFGVGGGVTSDPFGFGNVGGLTDTFLGGGVTGSFMEGGFQSATPDPVAAQDARFTMAEEQMAEVLGESARNSPERRRVEGLIRATGGRFTGDAANLNYLVKEYMMTTPGPMPPAERAAENQGGAGKRKRQRGGRGRGRKGRGRQNQKGPRQNNMNIGGHGQNVQQPYQDPYMQGNNQGHRSNNNFDARSRKNIQDWQTPNNQNWQTPNSNVNTGSMNGPNNQDWHHAAVGSNTPNNWQQPYPDQHNTVQPTHPPTNAPGGQDPYVHSGGSQSKTGQRFGQSNAWSSNSNYQGPPPSTLAPTQGNFNKNPGPPMYVNNQGPPPNTRSPPQYNNQGNLNKNPGPPMYVNNQGPPPNTRPSPQYNNQGNFNKNPEPPMYVNNQGPPPNTRPPPQYNNQGNFHQNKKPPVYDNSRTPQYNQMDNSPPAQNNKGSRTIQEPQTVNQAAILPESLSTTKAKTVSKQGPIAADRLRRIQNRIGSVNEQIAQAKQTNDLTKLDSLQTQLTALNGVKMILSGGRPGTNNMETLQGTPSQQNGNSAPPKRGLEPPNQYSNNGQINPYTEQSVGKGSEPNQRYPSEVLNPQSQYNQQQGPNSYPQQDQYQPAAGQQGSNFNQGPGPHTNQGQGPPGGGRQQRRNNNRGKRRRRNKLGNPSMHQTPPPAPTGPTTTTLAPQLGDTKWIGNEKYIYIDADNADTFQWVKERTVPRSQLDHLPQYQQQEGQTQGQGEPTPATAV